MPISRLNHAVFWVRDARVSAAFYRDVLEFDIAKIDDEGGRFAFLTAPGSQNDHDLALFGRGPGAGGPTAGPEGGAAETVGVYHVAWEVPTLADLVDVGRRLAEAGSLVGQSDHGVSKSLYAKDPDGLEFEVMWAVPPELLADGDNDAQTLPLDISAELERYGADRRGHAWM